MAVSFANKVWEAESGYLCLIFHEDNGFAVKVPRLSYSLGEQQFITVKQFEEKVEALEFAQQNYRADRNGYIMSIFESDD
ncbi:MAG: hypothetical protein KME09_01735 [Pleurocapsa minor HA4230-MV1]|jgi:hypothetical protein|nr:hypothetical protein [Pleurocapsa minor HA4230-MV1]